MKALLQNKVAQTIARSFLIGYGIAIVPMLIPATTDFGGFMHQVLNLLWWYRFFSSGMTGGLAFAVGQYMKSPFDKPSSSTPETLQFEPKKP